MAKKTATEKAFSEVKKNPPKVLAKTKRKKGAKTADRQRVAIALSKSRKAGANIPSPTRDDVLKRMKDRAISS